MRFKINFILAITGLMIFSSVYSEPENKTLTNLQAAYQDEANAVKKYELYAKKAREEGYEEVSKLFRAVSKSESIHMRNHKEAIENMGAKPQKIVYKNVVVKSTKENLEGPIQGEQKESETEYPNYIKTAKSDNADMAVKSFTYAMNSEKDHEMLFKNALANLGNNPDDNFFVSDVSGETFKVAKGVESPKTTVKSEKFIKIN